MFYGRNCFKRGASAAIFTCGVFYLTLNLLYHYLAVVKKTDGEVPGEETRAQDPRSFSKEDLTFLDEMNNRMFKRKTLLKNACKGLDSNLDHLSEMKLLIYEKYKLAYCFIPKSGSSNMKKLMLDIEGYNTTTVVLDFLLYKIISLHALSINSNVIIQSISTKVASLGFQSTST
ncbi:unnamed protein product [Clavelina lepadiformis]|uniref:Uncharacterized protein n=1 Tax=Clavelina lepadiformis TaxID=159417 RepID=A0ABP0F722_CLALP